MGRRTEPGIVGLLLLASAATVYARPPAPAPHCMDARQLQEMRQSAPRTLAIIDRNGDRHRIDLAQDCAAVGTAALIAPHGWVCGGMPGESLRITDRQCAVSRVTPLDPKGYAALALASHRDAEGVHQLAAVQVTAQKRRGFGGSPSYCFAPAHMRAWSEDVDGMIIEMSPRRAGGNRWYRVELGTSCVELSTATRIEIRSGGGNGLVCGNAGDRVTNAPEPLPVLAPDEFAGRLRGRGEKFGCPVAAVYPIERPGSQ